MASKLTVRIGADLSPLQASLKKAESSLKRFSFRAERIGRDLTTRVSLPILAIGGAAVKSFADFDKLEKGLSAVSGSAEEGSRQFKSLLALVKDTRTTLDLSTAANASLQLQSVGLAAEDAKRLLQGFGLAATVSGKGVEDVGGAVRQFTQVLAKGSIEQEDFITIAERIPLIGDLIRNELGFKTAEEIRESGISMTDLVERVTVAAEKSQVLAKANGGLSGSFIALKIGIQEAGFTLGGAISNALNLEENVAKLGVAIGNLADKFANLNPVTQKFIVFAGAALAAIGPLFLGLGGVARALPLLRSGFALLLGPITNFGGIIAAVVSPVGLVVAGIVALAAGIVIAYRNSETFRVQVSKLFEVFKTLASSVLRFGEILLNVVSNVLFPFGDGIDSISGAAKGLVAIFTGVISVITQVVSVVGEQLANVFDGFADIAEGNIKDGISKLSNSIANPLQVLKLATAGSDLAKTFGDAFTDTLDSLNSDIGSAFKPKVSEINVERTPIEQTSSGQSRAGATQSIDFDNDAINSFSLALQQVGRDTKFVQSKIEELKPTVQDDVFAPYREGLEVINEKQGIFGNSFDVLSEKINLAKSTISLLVEEGFSAQSGAIELATEQLRIYQDEFSKFENLTSVVDLIGNAMGKLGNLITSNLEKGASAFEGFGRAAIFAARDIIASQIRVAVVTQITKALASVPFPFNVGIAGTAGAVIESLIKGAITSISVPFLADGGITTGAQLAVIGEAGPEAVIPLPKLDALIQKAGGGMAGNVNFVIQGEDLVGVMSRANSSYNRSF